LKTANKLPRIAFF